MWRGIGLLGTCGTCLWLCGCSHFLETRVIQAWAASVQKEDLAKLRSVSSDEFEGKALESAESMQALKELDIPQGKLKVLKVVDDNGAKKVTVAVGKSKRKILVRLQKDDDRNQWVVDDVYLNRKEINLTHALSEQVYLRVAVRHFVAAWKDGSRGAVIGTTAPEFGRVLNDLPPEQLAEVTGKMMEEINAPDQVEPRTHLGEDTAEARLSKMKGTLVVKFRRLENHWKVEDLAIESAHDRERTPSVRQWAAAATAGLRFQAAYARHDKAALEQQCTSGFFEGSLALADLSLVKLPAPGTHKQLELTLEGHIASCVLTTPAEIVKITLALQNPGEPFQIPEYKVEDVTVYELDGSQNKRLSALFTAHALMQVFSDALIRRDVDTLRLSATRDFSAHVWERLNDRTLALMPLQEVRAGTPVHVSTSFQGPLTEMTVTQDDHPLTYVMRDQGGRMLVDDVLVPAMDRPESLRSTFELMIPIVEFTLAYQAGDVARLRQDCSRDFCKLVWNQTDVVPNLELSTVRHLRLPLTKVTMSPDSAWVQLGDDRFGAKVKLTKERDRQVVDDVLIIKGPEAQERVVLKRLLRVRLAEGMSGNRAATQAGLAVD